MHPIERRNLQINRVLSSYQEGGSLEMRRHHQKHGFHLRQVSFQRPHDARCSLHRRAAQRDAAGRHRQV